MKELEHVEAFFLGLKLGKVSEPSSLALLARRIAIWPDPVTNELIPGDWLQLWQKIWKDRCCGIPCIIALVMLPAGLIYWSSLI